MNRRVQTGAALGLWGLMVLSWVLESPEPHLSTTPSLLLVGFLLPLATLLLAWMQKVPILFSCGFPLSLLPFVLLHPEALSHQFHSPWTYIPIGLLWFFLIIPAHQVESHETYETEMNEKFPFRHQYILLASWYTIGILGIFLGRWLIGEDTVPIADHWITLGAIVWVGPLLLLMRYRKK